MQKSALIQLASRMVHGQILTPEDLKAECQELKQRPDLSGYVLTGWVTETEAAMIEDRALPHAARFSLYPTPSDGTVAVTTLQAGPLQVRWFVPLIDERPRAWVRWSVDHSMLGCLLEIGEGRQVTWCQMPLSFAGREVLEKVLAKPFKVDYAKLFVECAVLNAQFAYDDTVPTCVPGVPVTQVRCIAVTDGLTETAQAAPAEQQTH